MKAGIITLHFSVNYGAVLQCLALTQTLEKQGIDVSVINYYPQYAKYYWEPSKSYIDAIKDAIAASNKKSIHKNGNIAVRCIKSLKYAYVMNHKVEDYKRKYKEFDKFRKAYLPLTDERNKFEELQELSFDLLITGSDQVWNLNYTNYVFDEAYFLKFGKKDTLRLAYAVSTHVYKDDETWLELLNLAKEIDYISVREKNVCDKIEEFSCGKKIVTVLDPTLLLEASEWEKFEKSCIYQNKYILVYCLHERNLCLSYLKNIKVKYKHLDIIDISPDRLSTNSIWRGDCNPGEFLNLFHHASMIITDSFHGTVFSIIYNRQFISVASKLSDTRIQDLLNSVGLNERCKNTYDKLPTEDIKYASVNKKVALLRRDSIRFLLHGIRR